MNLSWKRRRLLGRSECSFESSKFRVQQSISMLVIFFRNVALLGYKQRTEVLPGKYNGVSEQRQARKTRVFVRERSWKFPSWLSG